MPVLRRLVSEKVTPPRGTLYHECCTLPAQYRTLTVTPTPTSGILQAFPIFAPKDMSHQDSEPEEAITKEEIRSEEPTKKSTRNACKSHTQLTRSIHSYI